MMETLGWRAAAVAIGVSGCVTSAEVGGKPQDDAGGSGESSTAAATAESSETGDEAGTTDPGPMGYDDVVEPGPPLAVGRARHVAVLLDDGNVFVAGGFADADTILKSIEIFRPAQNDVVPGGELLDDHYDGCAVRLLDGRVMILGGAVATTDIWDPATQASTPGPMLEYGAGLPMCMVTPEGHVIVADSYTAGKGYLIERWRPGDASFERLPSATELEYLGGHSAALLADGNRVLLIGGSKVWDGEEPPPDPAFAQVYDLAAETFRRVEGWPEQGEIIVEANGDAIVYRTSTEGFVAARFDGQSETLEDITPSGDYNLHSMASTRTDGVALLAGGFELDAADELVHTDRVLRWDAGAGELVVVGTLGAARSHGTATRLADGRIAIIGGATGNLGVPNIDIYR